MKLLSLIVTIVVLSSCGINSSNDPRIMKYYNMDDLDHLGCAYIMEYPYTHDYDLIQTDLAPAGSDRWEEPEYYGLMLGGPRDTIMILDTIGAVTPGMQLRLMFLYRGE